ncbi:hypothetical protein [Streptococcus anginosus]|uniref:hypothetical protein n=1 Tax=Streptococcus anginosus TaxID=1328 RepID=UPI002220461D|nr:hypothetical protein [Streptococcus anginosus]MCW0947025.1 hypothetical protein [Streptococcus anginosus]
MSNYDRSVALCKNGEILTAIVEERLDRIKHSVGFYARNPKDDGCSIGMAYLGSLSKNIKAIPLKSILGQIKSFKTYDKAKSTKKEHSKGAEI